MPVESHLGLNEKLISRCHPFYATSKRLIRYQTRKGQEQVYQLPYDSLSSIELVQRPSHRMMMAGTGMTILGAILAAMGLFTSILALIAGIGVVAYGGMNRPSCYQIRARDMPKVEEGRWRIDLNLRASGAFIATLRTIIGERPEL